jgi:hypothetical protein
MGRVGRRDVFCPADEAEECAPVIEGVAVGYIVAGAGDCVVVLMQVGVQRYVASGGISVQPAIRLD